MDEPFWKEQYKQLLDIWNQKSNRFWIRFNAFLAINSGLITAFSYLLSFQNTNTLPQYIIIFVGIIGITFSFIWYLIIFFSRKWQSLRHDQGKQIEDNHKEIEVKIFTDVPFKKSFLRDTLKIRPTITNICYVIPVIFIIIWILFIFSLV